MLLDPHFSVTLFTANVKGPIAKIGAKNFSEWRTENMKSRWKIGMILAGGAVLASIIGGAGSASATPTHGDYYPKAPYVLVIWKNPAGSPKFPQDYVTSTPTSSTVVDGSLDGYNDCGTFYQADLYANNAQTQALIAGKVLHGGDESWPDGIQRYTTKTTPACVTVPPQPADKVVTTTSDNTVCKVNDDGSGFVYTTTTTVTTPYIYDKETNTWVLGTPGAPVSDTTKCASSASECPVTSPPATTPPATTPPTSPPVIVPPTKPVHPVTRPVGHTTPTATTPAPFSRGLTSTPAPATALAYTGTKAGIPTLIAGLMLALGLGILGGRAFVLHRRKSRTGN